MNCNNLLKTILNSWWKSLFIFNFFLTRHKTLNANPTQPNSCGLDWIVLYICDGLGLVENFSTRTYQFELKKSFNLTQLNPCTRLFDPFIYASQTKSKPSKPMSQTNRPWSTKMTCPRVHSDHDIGF
jgi:hypothetical protein